MGSKVCTGTLRKFSDKCFKKLIPSTLYGVIFSRINLLVLEAINTKDVPDIEFAGYRI